MDNSEIPSEIMADWAAEHQDAIHRWVQKALKRFWEDASVRVPRTEAERRNGMEAWLEQQRLKLSAALQEEFQQEFYSLAQIPSQPYHTNVFEELVWPEVKPEVYRYAIRSFAAAWRTGHMGDATTVGVPAPMGKDWRVPIGVRGYGDNLGQIILTADGDVIPELTTSRTEILEALRGSTLPRVAATAGKQ